MSQNKPDLSRAQLKQYDRLMLRSSFVSLFWSIICDLKMRRKFTLQELADQIGVDKSGVSRWFSGNTPNWTIDTISDIANALNVDLKIEATDRTTQAIYTPQGKQVEHRRADDPFKTEGDMSAFDIRPLKPDVNIDTSSQNIYAN